MRYIEKKWYGWYQKHRVAVFFCGIVALIIFSTNLFIHGIPDKLYVTEFEKDISLSVPVTLTPQEQIETVFSGQKWQQKEQLYSNVQKYTCHLFGMIPLKTISVQKCEHKKVVPGGIPVGIYAQTEGVLVIGVGEVTGVDGKTETPAKNLVYPGDYMIAMGEQPIREKEDIIQILSNWNDKESVEVTVLRKGEERTIKVPVVKTKEGNSKLGIWVRDDLAGVGTLTYYDKEGNYAALGHCVSDYDTNEMLRVSKGKLYQIQIAHIQKGEMGTPGELAGLIDYQKKHCLGSVGGNKESGIYGKLEKFPEELRYEKEIELGKKQKIKRGKAEILSYVDGTRKTYSIEILDLDFQSKEEKDILFRVTDSRLIETTGGIVQGMSGSPILQDGRLIGAVTHVFIRDPQRGYGIFIDDMCYGK